MTKWQLVVHPNKPLKFEAHADARAQCHSKLKPFDSLYMCGNVTK